MAKSNFLKVLAMGPIRASSGAEASPSTAAGNAANTEAGVPRKEVGGLSGTTTPDRPSSPRKPGKRPQSSRPAKIPYMEVEWRGKRPLRFCRTVQDAHTASEQLAYQAIWSYAQKRGSEEKGSFLVDLGLSQICFLLATDHKHAKSLIEALHAKLAIETVRQPNYQLSMPTRYRVFNYSQILERRRAAGLIWVLRTRTIRFVDLETVAKLMEEDPTPHGSSTQGDPMGHSPMGGDGSFTHGVPVGDSPKRPMDHSPTVFSKSVGKGRDGQEIPL